MNDFAHPAAFRPPSHAAHGPLHPRARCAEPPAGKRRRPLPGRARRLRRARLATLVRILHPVRHKHRAAIGADTGKPQGPSTDALAKKHNGVTMGALPNQSDAQFQAFMNRLLEQPEAAWSEKQRMEIHMAHMLSADMLQMAERMRAGHADLESGLVLLKYAKVLDYILSSLAARREIHPQTLRTIFRLANLKIHDAYPE